MSSFRTATVLLIAALLGSVAGTRAAEPARGQPLVRVNGRTITTVDLDRYAALQPQEPFDRQATDQTSEKDENAARREMLKSLVDHHLVLEKARQAYVRGESAEQMLDEYAEEQLHQMEERFGSRLKARKFLARKGLTIERYKELQVETLLVVRYMWDQVLDPVTVSPAEMRRYYRERRSEFRRPRAIVYRQILLTTGDRAERNARRRLARDILGKLENGADFAALADRYSADADRYPGGRHRVEVPAEQPGWRPAAVEGLEVGELSGVRETSPGFCITRLEEVREPRVVSFTEAQDQIRRKLLRRKRAEAQREFLDELRRRARVRYMETAKERNLVAEAD
ncbi:MAG: peptidylprolyl isomerase [Planctomycetota bacterium]